MKNRWRFLLSSFVVTLLFFGLFLLLGNLIFRDKLLQIRTNYFLGLARIIAASPDYETAAKNIRMSQDGTTGTTTVFWIVSEDGEILFSSTTDEIPREDVFLQLDQAKNLPHEQTLEIKHKTGIYVFVKIPSEKSPVLIVKSLRQGFVSKITLWVLMIIFISALVLWIFANVLFSLYIRSRESEIESLLQKFEKGDFSRRLRINFFDRSMGLFQSFNPMADRLEKALDMIKKGEAEKMELIQEMAHDLRTPLTSLMTASESLLEKSLEPQIQNTLLQLVHQEVQYLNRLIEDLFFISEIQMHRKPSAVFSVDKVFQDELAGILSVFPKAQIQTQIPPIKVNSDEVLFRRLISNIVKNSLQAGATQIEILCQQNSSLVQLKFTDNGPGLSESQLLNYGQKNKVRVFHQKDFKGSLGLGSVIIQKIVSALKGHIHVSNCENKRGLQIQIEIESEIIKS